MSNTLESTEVEIDKSMPPQDVSEDGNSVVHQGKGRANSTFGKSLEKFVNKDESSPANNSESHGSTGDDKPDPIAAKAAAEKKEPKKEDAKPASDKKEEPAEEAKPERKSLKNLLDDKPKAKAEDKSSNESSDSKKEKDAPAVSDSEIEEELKNPHKSEKAQKRFMELHRRWKDAEAKLADTPKKLAEKEALVADLQKKLADAGKAAGVAPEVQAQLDELAQYRRQYEVEKSPEYTKFDLAYKETESEIANILKGTGLKFQGMTQEQTIAFIEAEGGYDAFQRKNPKIAKQIREDLLDPAQNDDLTAAMSRQKLLKKAQEAYLKGEKENAKEYFTKKELAEKEKAEAAAKAPKPEDLNAKRKAALEAWREDTFTKLDFFKEEDVPAEASEATRKAIKEKNKFSADLRKTLAENLNVQSDEDLMDVALAATLAHKIKREKDELASRVEQLEAELKKVKGAGRTVIKSTQPASAPSSEKPAPNFSAALDRVAARRE